MTDSDPALIRALKRTVLTVALLNLGYMAVEMAVALAVGSVSLFADSVDRRRLPHHSGVPRGPQ